jgi:predicted transcriptional regulator
MKTLKEQIEQFVGESGVTRYRIAKEAGVTEVLLSRIKNGTQKDAMSSKVTAIHAAMRRMDPAAAAKALEDADAVQD